MNNELDITVEQLPQNTVVIGNVQETDYNYLVNKPQINGTTVEGSKTGAEYGLVSKTDKATVSNLGIVKVDGETIVVSDDGTIYATGGKAEWGHITGTLSDQTDLQSALNAKMDKSGGTFTGDVTLSSGVSLNTPNGKLHEVNNKIVLGDSSDNGLYVNPNGQTAALINGGTVKNIITSADVKSTYSSTGLDPVNGTAVASAVSTKQDSTLSAPISIGGTTQTTVEGALGAIVDLPQNKFTVINGGDSTNA